MLVKCKCHNEKKDRNTLYKVVINNKNEYYCNESEYIKKIKNKEFRKNCLEQINDIFGYIITNTVMSKEIADMAAIYTYEKISLYLQDNIKQLSQYLSKDFNSEYGKIKYFSTILKNNLRDYVANIKKEEIKPIIEEITEFKYKQKCRKKSLSEFIREME